jgi:hypothetical protein
VTDELAERRLPEWARKLQNIRLGAEIRAGVFAHPKWAAENPGKPVMECPEHLLVVQFALIGHEHHPAVLAGQTDRKVSAPALVLGHVPWADWRKAMDAELEGGDLFLPTVGA